MTVDPRDALARLTAAFEAHLHAVVSRRSDDDPAVDEAYYVLADAFDVYDDALATEYGEALPFYVVDDDDDSDDDDSDDDDSDDDDDDDDDDDSVDDDDDEDSDDDLEGLSEDDLNDVARPDR